MAENKKFGADPADLKKADAEKSAPIPQPKLSQDSVGSGLHAGFADVKRDRNDKKIPIAVDVIIAILMLAIVIGVVAGAYYLFRYFSDDYEGIEVEYTFIKIADTGSLVRYRAMKNQEVYIDAEDNTQYFGRVISSGLMGLDEEQGVSMLVLVIRSNVKYRPGEGYTCGDYRIAVGSEYTLHTKLLTVEGTIVEMAGYEVSPSAHEEALPPKNDTDKEGD